MERTQQQVLKGYMPVVKEMSLDYVAAVVAVAHHNRSIIRKIEVTPGVYLPVKMYVEQAVWEEAKTEY
jgi:hypothetical protein